MTMRLIASTSVFALLAGCGGGGAYQQPPPPIPMPRSLTITLVAAGNVPKSAQEFPLPSRTINSQADYDLLIQGRLGGVFNIPTADSTVDFTTTSLFYLEGTPDNDPASAVRALSAVKNANGTFEVSSEACGLPIVTTGIHRPWALYKTEAGMTSATFVWSQKAPPSCTSVTQAPATRIAAGTLPFSATTGAPQRLIITSQSDWNSLQSRIASVLPSGFTPDFSASSLVYVDTSDNDPNMYVRVVSALRSQDGSVDVGVEKCGSSIVFIPNHSAFALYSIPKPTGAVRLTAIESEPPGCITSP